MVEEPLYISISFLHCHLVIWSVKLSHWSYAGQGAISVIIGESQPSCQRLLAHLSYFPTSAFDKEPVQVCWHQKWSVRASKVWSKFKSSVQFLCKTRTKPMDAFKASGLLCEPNISTMFLTWMRSNEFKSPFKTVNIIHLFSFASLSLALIFLLWLHEAEFQ